MFHRFAPRTAALALLAALALTGPVRTARAADPVPAPDPAQVLSQTLRSVLLADGLVADQVILFPLYVLGAPAPLDVAAGVAGRNLRASEPEAKPGKELVRVANGEPKMVLLPAGSVLEGGKRDRMVRFDRLIPANDVADVEVLPAAMASDVRKDAVDFKLQDFLAPSYLRETAQFTNSTSIVQRFVSHFMEFRNPSDKRASLAAIGASDALADYCLVCQRTFSEWPTKKGAGTVVGGIAVVRGRLQSLEIFANNQHLQDFFAPVLKSLSFPAAAIDLRAKKVGLPLPGKDEPAGTVEVAMKAAKELLASLAGATFTVRKTGPDFVGQAFTIKAKDGTRGSALLLDGRLVHASLYPDDPFEASLYSQPLTPMEGEDASGDPTDEANRAELERRQASGARLTPAEQRLLERLRSRPSIPGPH